MPVYRLIDYHMHTRVTIDGNMVEIQACVQAVRMGLREIAFTNHVMLNHPAYLMSEADFVLHWRQVQLCQKRFPELTIRLGIEMDYYPGREAEIAVTLRKYENLIGRHFDIVLGAVHEMNGIFFSSKEHAPRLFSGRALAAVYLEYFDLTAKAVRSGLYDILAHPDLVKKYTGEITPPLDFESYRVGAERLVDALLETGVGIDLNMKGMKLKVGEQFPSRQFLQLYLSRARASGREPVLTLGSDAHTATDVGGYIQEGAEMLLDLGQPAYCTFIERKRTQVRIVN